MNAPAVAPPVTDRDTRTSPRRGDTFRFGQLWVVVASTAPRTVLRLIRPGVRETTTSVALPLPPAMVPAPWTRQELMRASSRVGRNRRAS